MAVLLKRAERAFRCVDRQMTEIGAAQSFQLRIEIGEVTSLKQRVVAEVNSWHDILRAKCDLLSLGKEIIDAAIKHQPADYSDRDLFFGNELGRIQYVEREFLGEFFIEELNPSSHSGKLPD